MIFSALTNVCIAFESSYHVERGEKLKLEVSNYMTRLYGINSFKYGIMNIRDVQRERKLKYFWDDLEGRRTNIPLGDEQARNAMNHTSRL